VHASCWVSDQTLPSAVVQFQIQVKKPVDVVADGAVAAAGAVVGVQAQFQVEPFVGAALAAVAPAGGVPAPVQTQFHDQVSPGAPPVLPGRSIETCRLEPPLTVTTLRSGLVPTALAPFFWVTVPSLPGLPTRMETLMFCAPVCVALAEPVDEDAAGSTTVSPITATSGPGPSCVWSSCWSTVPSFVARAPPLIVSTT